MQNLKIWWPMQSSRDCGSQLTPFARFSARSWNYPVAQVVKTKTGQYKTRKRPAWVKDLIKHLFPDASEQEVARLIAFQLANERSSHKSTGGDVDGACDEGLLEVISGLDPENAIDAKGLRQECFERLLIGKSRNVPEAKAKAEPTSGWKKENYTPSEFKSLLPPTEKYIYIKRVPGQSTYTGFYDRGLKHDLSAEVYHCFKFYQTEGCLFQSLFGLKGP